MSGWVALYSITHLCMLGHSCCQPTQTETTQSCLQLSIPKIFGYRWSQSVSALQSFLGRLTWGQIVEKRRDSFHERIRSSGREQSHCLMPCYEYQLCILLPFSYWDFELMTFELSTSELWLFTWTLFIAIGCFLLYCATLLCVNRNKSYRLSRLCAVFSGILRNDSTDGTDVQIWWWLIVWNQTS